MLRMVGAAGVWICGVSMALAGAEQRLLVDDFARPEESQRWSPSEKATVSFSPGRMHAEFPAYIPDSPERWPGVARSVSDINFGEFNGLRVELTNPTDLVQPMQVNFKDATGRRTVSVAIVQPRSTQTITVDFDRMATGGVDWTAVSELSLYRTEPSHPFVWDVGRIELFADRPEATAMGQLRDLMTRARQAMKKAERSTRLSRDQIAAARQTLDRWNAALGDHKTITGKSQACRESVSAVISQLLAAELAESTGQELIAWNMPIGTSFRPAEALVDFREPSNSIKIAAAAGEYQEALVRLSNISAAAKDVRIEVESDEPALADAISVRRNLPVRAMDESVIGDVLVPMDEAGALSIGASETVELWIRLDRKHSKLPAGPHAAKLRVRDLRSGKTSELPMEISAWSFDLASVQPMRVTLYTGLSPVPQYRIVHGKEGQARDNMIDYGVNVFTLWPDAATRQVPYPRLTPAGELAEPIDYTEHDRAIAFFRQGGNRPLFKMCLNFDVKAELPNWTLRNNLEPGSEAWKRGLRVWITDWVAHLKELDVSTSEFAFYLSDEPDAAELDRYRLVGSIIKSIDPSLQIFINGSELYSDESLNAELMNLVDIWNPNEAVGLFADPELVPTLQKHGEKEIWVYECKTGVRARSNNPYDSYRLMTWRALRDGLTGVGYWHYCYQGETSETPWDGTSSSSSEVFLVYPGKDQLLMSVRWELFREALEDARLYRLLQQLPAGTERDALLGERFQQVLQGRSDPELAEIWRWDAGELLDKSGG